MIDIVIPYRTSKTDELKYTLRAIERHLEHGKIVIVGDIPDWVQNALTIPTERSTHKHQLDCELNIRAALPYLSDEFYLFNDDFILLKPLEDIPNYHEGDIDDVVKIKARSIVTSNVAKKLINTRAFLHSKGVEYPVAYTLHIPVKYKRDNYQRCSDLILPTLKRTDILPRTIYGNLYGDSSVIHKDVKIYTKDQPLPNDDFVSTWENSWDGIAGDSIRAMFKDKSRYEV